MLTDMQANNVMGLIQSLSNFGGDEPQDILLHLNEMHNLRDVYLRSELLVRLTPPTMTSVAEALAWDWGPYNALRNMQ